MIAWRYLPTGRVKHAITRTANGGVAGKAECGVSPWGSGQWHGTGNQEEYDTVKKFPVCMHCTKLGYVFREEDL